MRKKFSHHILTFTITLFVMGAHTTFGQIDETFFSDIQPKFARERLLMGTRDNITNVIAGNYDGVMAPSDTIPETLIGLRSVHEYLGDRQKKSPAALAYIMEHYGDLEELSYTPSTTSLQISTVLSLYLKNLESRKDRAYKLELLRREISYHKALSSLPAGFVVPVAPTSDTYQAILIDISDQRMYVYEEGVLVGTTPVTTGKKGYPTVKGNFSVKQKQTKRILNSPFPNDPYRLHVDYWIQFQGGFGIHDACNSINCWRTKFGGKDYVRSGSHGCVNTPYEFVAWLYEWSLTGTRVRVQS